VISPEREYERNKTGDGGLRNWESPTWWLMSYCTRDPVAFDHAEYPASSPYQYKILYINFSIEEKIGYWQGSILTLMALHRRLRRNKERTSYCAKWLFWWTLCGVGTDYWRAWQCQNFEGQDAFDPTTKHDHESALFQRASWPSLKWDHSIQYNNVI
jgi:hypothetical protein